jgi:hypothetical protein
MPTTPGASVARSHRRQKPPPPVRRLRRSASMGGEEGQHSVERRRWDTSERSLLNRRLEGHGSTLFAEMSALAVRTGALNLGQGFPDTDGPEERRARRTAPAPDLGRSPGHIPSGCLWPTHGPPKGRRSRFHQPRSRERGSRLLGARRGVLIPADARSTSAGNATTERNGTIPAGAGSTTPGAGAGPGSRDHPRGRGEHISGSGTPYPQWGPSPRARGAPDVPEQLRAPLGTIPAGAGSTGGVWGRPSAAWDHPRGRGEHGLLHQPPCQVAGPSPRARGALGRPDHHLGYGGTIPAGAGSTDHPSNDDRPARDHPRGRGEHSRFAWRQARPAGPSPRARGARRLPWRR